MGIRLDKPWRPVAEAPALPGQLGVFELADAVGTVIYIGVAGGRTLFGLRSEVIARSEEFGATSFRCEVTTAYHTRRQELLMVHRADFDRLPEFNVDDLRGRLSPA